MMRILRSPLRAREAVPLCPILCPDSVERDTDETMLKPDFDPADLPLARRNHSK